MVEYTPVRHLIGSFTFSSGLRVISKHATFYTWMVGIIRLLIARSMCVPHCQAKIFCTHSHDLYNLLVRLGHDVRYLQTDQHWYGTKDCGWSTKTDLSGAILLFVVHLPACTHKLLDSAVSLLNVVCWLSRQVGLGNDNGYGRSTKADSIRKDYEAKQGLYIQKRARV